MVRAQAAKLTSGSMVTKPAAWQTNDPDRYAFATLGHELMHAALLCEAMGSNANIPVQAGGGIPLFAGAYITNYVLQELMK